MSDLEKSMREISAKFGVDFDKQQSRAIRAFKAQAKRDAKMYVLTLVHGPNEDIMHDERKGYWTPPKVPRTVIVRVESIQIAKEFFEAWRDDNGFGASNVQQATIVQNGNYIGEFWYNGHFDRFKARK